MKKKRVLTAERRKPCGTPFCDGEFASGGCCRSCCEDKFAPPKDGGGDFDGEDGE